MEPTFGAQAATFLEKVAGEQKKLLAYALHLTKDTDEAHDLYSDTLLRCRDRIAVSGFNGEGYVAYMITSLKGNFYYARRQGRVIDPVELLEVQTGEDSGEERMALAAAVRAYIVAHYSTEEVAAFELHAHGCTMEEVSFLTDYPNKVQVHRVVQKIKKGVRVAFGR
ncbi:sigma-70 family RNA polymerase sigma factor [Rufibacter quisquiliarum]|uniref:DNA-directed RNA polymerase specialized sigma24 family protein n=1 Tax=Rufibacter quisquiliarum TaxID=1549639 RepID=A0A839GQF0_9BACT|nr:sigma-70 family RNA polymerase sigma factor [Rufibacter quisquiliarum]MBA9076061.1 DNA-directed RNA polymerase specialized sigma24 family protein [Rufibacter quisquiliarum]